MKLNKIFIVTIMSLFVVSSLGQYALGYGGPPEQSSANNYTVEINSDNESYALGESVVFSGVVSKYDEERSLRISIFDSKSNLVVTQKTVVNEDSTFSHTVSLNEKFSDGKHTVKAQYGSSKATVAIISFEVSSDATSSGSSSHANIPDWIKTSSGFWVDEVSSDGEFVSAIQFLIKEGIIQIPPTTQGSTSAAEVPSWIKTTVGFWVDGNSSDTEFISAMQFLIKEGLMKISN